MTKSPGNCPRSEQLKALLDGSLTEPGQSTLQSHVDGCATCQKALESLVAGTESWDAAVGHLRGESVQPDAAILSEAIRNLKADEFFEASAREGSVSMKPLEFLEPSDRPGSIGRLGVYEVTEVVGQGGMGVVLKAFDPSLHRVVAVKVLAPYLAHNPLARKRFIREAQAIAAVCHDHVITIHAIDESAEQPKIVMQFVAGRSLQDKLDTEGSLDLKEILRIGMQTASGLAAAHAQGLVHRDVKPSNILLENGIQRVKLTDFGLARAVDDASLTQSGVIAGTPQYMAPEQANGDAVDYRADLFSLGSVMYAMCVGHSPFRASTTMGVLKRVCHDPPRPIQELNPDVPDWLCAIVTKLLAKQPENRFQSAKSVSEVLEKWLAHVQQPSVVPRPLAVERGTVESEQPSPSMSTRNPPSGGPSAKWYESQRLLDSGTILFQPISGRLLLFFYLTGMAISYAVARENRVGLEESLLVSVMGGMFTCFWGLLFVSLIRLVWANVYGAVRPPASKSGNSGSPIGDSNLALPRSGWRLPPESIAMLAALGTLVIGGHFLLAAIVAIVAWRVATHYARTEASRPDSLSDSEATRVHSEAASSSFAARVNSVFQAPIAALQRMGQMLGSLFDLEATERNRLLIAITWYFVCWVDLLGSAAVATWLFNARNNPALVIVEAALSLAMSLLSFTVAHCVYVRQNFNLVRAASVIGLLPVSVGAIVRIPLSVITLLWQHTPSVKESFAIMPWPETDLGRLVGGNLSRSLQRGVGTLGRIVIWSVLCLILLILTLSCYVIPYGPSDYHVYDGSASPVMLKDNSSQLGFFMDASGTGRAYGLLPPSHVYLRDTIRLSATPHRPGAPAVIVRLGFPATIEKNGQTRQFTEEDCDAFFQTISGKPLPQHADSLFQAIQWINAVRDKHPSSPRPSAEQFQSGSSISFAEWMSLLSRAFLHAEPLHANRPLRGFVAASTLLNQELFAIRPGAEGNVSNSCMPTAWVLATLFIGFPLAWLIGVWRIVRRRHWKRTVISDSPPTMST